MTSKTTGVLFQDLFRGARSYSATATSNAGHEFAVTDTSSAGTPTYAAVATGKGVAVDLASTTEVENVCLSFGDVLSLDIDDISDVEFDVKMNQAAVDTATSFAIGLASERSDAIDTIAEAALFRVIGADSTTAVVVETDDGTTNNDDVATGATLINATKTLKISFAAGKSDVRFFIDGQPVATATTFDMSAYSGGLQVYAQIQKTSDSNTNGFTLERVRVRGKIR